MFKEHLREPKGGWEDFRRLTGGPGYGSIDQVSTPPPGSYAA